MTRAGAVVLSGLALGLAAAAAPAAAQVVERPSVLLVLDSSKSMNEPAGNGGTRLDAAKGAVTEVLDAVPADAPLGLRVYGAEVSESTRRAGCRDTRLVAPVAAGTGARARVAEAVRGLQGKGRTPIGRSLLATPGDFRGSGRRQVILVSDGGDNCAPPAPCRAARSVARQGVELSISVVGLQVNARVRRQLRCIAEAGGGTYVDATDPDKLREELLAAFARAFRGFQPRGTRLRGTPERADAVRVGEGLYQGELRPDEIQHVAVELEPGQRLATAATLVVPLAGDGTGAFELELLDARGDRVAGDSSVAGGGGNTVTGRSVTLALATAAAGLDDELPPGPYFLRLSLEGSGLDAAAIPYELAVQGLDPDERPGLVREAGPAPEPPAQPTPTPAAPRDRATPDDDGGGGRAPLLASVAAGGLVAGLAGGVALRRRRRT